MRLGFTVSRQVGNAVVRNRVRRRLREMVRLTDADKFCPGHDYVLIGRPPALHLPFADMTRDFADALRRVHTAPARTSVRANTGTGLVPAASGPYIERARPAGRTRHPVTRRHGKIRDKIRNKSRKTSPE